MLAEYKAKKSADASTSAPTKPLNSSSSNSKSDYAAGATTGAAGKASTAKGAQELAALQNELQALESICCGTRSNEGAGGGKGQAGKSSKTDETELRADTLSAGVGQALTAFDSALRQFCRLKDVDRARSVMAARAVLNGMGSLHEAAGRIKELAAVCTATVTAAASAETVAAAVAGGERAEAAVKTSKEPGTTIVSPTSSEVLLWTWLLRVAATVISRPSLPVLILLEIAELVRSTRAGVRN
jgi:hypothetical protein